MTNPNEIANRYIEVWNEPDAENRRRLISRIWSESAHYIDPLMRGESHDGMDAMIAGAQQQFSGHCVALAGTPDGYADRVRFSWVLRAADGVAVARATDFATLSADGRLGSVTGFLDAASS